MRSVTNPSKGPHVQREVAGRKIRHRARGRRKEMMARRAGGEWVAFFERRTPCPAEDGPPRRGRLPRRRVSWCQAWRQGRPHEVALAPVRVRSRAKDPMPSGGRAITDRGLQRRAPGAQKLSAPTGGRGRPATDTRCQRSTSRPQISSKRRGWLELQVYGTNNEHVKISAARRDRMPAAICCNSCSRVSKNSRLSNSNNS